MGLKSYSTNTHIMVVACISVGIDKSEWKKYASKNNEHLNFEIDFAILLTNYMIESEWDRHNE